jgi:hypothetical protein
LIAYCIVRYMSIYGQRPQLTGATNSTNLGTDNRNYSYLNS